VNIYDEIHKCETLLDIIIMQCDLDDIYQIQELLKLYLLNPNYEKDRKKLSE